jgi:hypothetical protein
MRCARWLVLAAASMTWLAGAAAPEQPPTWRPRGLRITPNALQSEDVTMLIEAAGEPKATAWLFVLRDCDRDRRPDWKSRNACVTPVKSWTRQLDARGDLKEKMDFRQHPDIPRNAPLWLSVCSSAAPDTSCADALFGLVENACTLFQSMIDAVTSGPCDPKLHRMLGSRRVSAGTSAARFEVRTATPSEAPVRARSVPGTDGATGVAWQTSETLLVTAGPPQVPGLYRMKEDGRDRIRLWKAPRGALPRAPVALGGGWIAFVLERGTPDSTPAVSLMIWNGKVTQDVLLDRPISRLYETRTRSALIARAADDPGFLYVDVEARKVTSLGFSGSLLHLLQRSPGSSVVALDYEDVANDNGWDLALVNERGEGVVEVSVGPGDARAPAWRPDGGRFAYLSEIGR